MKRLMLILSLIFLVSCSVSKVPDPATKALSIQDEIVISGGEEVAIKVIGIKGDKGDPGVGEKGEKGDPGPPGPQGPPGTGSGVSYMYNVRDYGAKGDGKTDDSEAFQRCFDATPKGGTVFIPDGKYLVSKTFVFTRQVTIRGQGFDTQICQLADKTLFHFDGVSARLGGCNIANLNLGSYSTKGDLKTGEGSSIVFYDRVGYSFIDRVWLCGGFNGIRMRGSLQMMTRGIGGYWGSPYFFKRVPLNVHSYIFAERAYGYAVNNHKYYDLYLQGGNGGIKIVNTSAEGGIYMNGLIEGMRKFSVDARGIMMHFIIDGLWCEGKGSDIYLNAVSGAIIKGLYGGGVKGLVMRNCRSPEIIGGYIRSIDADRTCNDVKVSGTRIQYMNLFRPETASTWGIINPGDVWKGAYGQFVRPNWTSPVSLCNYKLNIWEDGLPRGYTAPYTKVEKETALTFQGRGTAKISIDKTYNYYGLRFPLQRKDFAGRRSALTISAWVYKPSAGGINPRIYLVYGGSGGVGVPFHIVPGKWTPITFTVHVNPDSAVDPYVLWGTYPKSQADNGVFYLSMPTIRAGM